MAGNMFAGQYAEDSMPKEEFPVVLKKEGSHLQIVSGNVAAETNLEQNTDKTASRGG